MCGHCFVPPLQRSCCYRLSPFASSTLQVPLQEGQALPAPEGVLPALRRQAEGDRAIMDAGTRAFVSYIRAYKEHQCRCAVSKPFYLFFQSNAGTPKGEQEECRRRATERGRRATKVSAGVRSGASSPHFSGLDHTASVSYPLPRFIFRLQDLQLGPLAMSFALLRCVLAPRVVPRSLTALVADAVTAVAMMLALAPSPASRGPLDAGHVTALVLAPAADSSTAPTTGYPACPRSSAWARRRWRALSPPW